MKFEWANLVWALIGGIGGALLIALSTAATYGEIRADVRTLKDRVDRIEKGGRSSGSSLFLSKAGKGDLCLTLMSSLQEAYRTSNDAVAEDIKDQLGRFGCDTSVPAVHLDGPTSPEMSTRQ